MKDFSTSLEHPEWFQVMLRQIYGDIESSLGYFWPSTDKWPHENLILVSLVRYASSVDGFLYPECSMKTSDGYIRRDAILISKRLRVVLQCELKHFWQYDPVIRDIDRVRDASVLSTFLRGGGVTEEVFDYNWYGLFFGYGHIHNSCGEVWRSAKSVELRRLIANRLPEHERQKLHIFAEIQNHAQSCSGLLTPQSANIPERKQFWLAYLLEELQK